MSEQKPNKNQNISQDKKVSGPKETKDLNIQSDQVVENITSFAKRRAFIYPDSEIYGGLANSWDYGPYGVLLKQNIKNKSNQGAARSRR